MASQSPREAIVSIRAKPNYEKPLILNYQWFVVEFNDKEIVLVEARDSTEAIVVPREDVVNITYADT